LISTGEHHLILIVKGAGANWVLDNLKPDIERVTAMRNGYALDRVESGDNPKLWTHSRLGLS
jgi:predicted transglutaminase-like cysteine proteinase